MNDKQQLAAMGEHMRDMEEINDAYGRLSVSGLLRLMSGVEGELGVEFVFAGCHFSIRGAQTYKFNGHHALELYGEKMHDFSFFEFKVPDGWKLVPVEPTDDMVNAAIKVSLRNTSINGVHQYRAMLDAAPEYKP